MRVFNFGSINIDYVYEVEEIVKNGETISSNKQNEFVGGKGLNQSISLAKAGVEVEHVGVVGEKDKQLTQALEAVGVSTKFVKRITNLSGHAIIQVDKKGNNAIIVFPGANNCLDKNYIDEVFKSISSEDIVLLQNEISNVDYIVEKSYENGNKVYLNPSPFTDALLEVDFNKVHCLLINEIEGETITQKKNPEQICERLVQDYHNLNVILTLGEKGAMFHNNTCTEKHDAFITEVVDTTAAGDTFTGYFIANFLDDKEIKDCLKIACLASSCAVSKKGASDSIPFLKEVREKLASIEK